MATYYRWRKSTVKWTDVSTPYSNERTLTGAFSYYQSGDLDGELNFNENNGTYSLPFVQNEGGTTVGESLYLSPRRYMILTGTSSTLVIQSTNDGTLKVTINLISVTIVGNNVSTATWYSHVARQGPGTSQGYVYSTSSSAYPNGGVSGSYYYDQRTTVTSPTAPTGLTYPNPITTPTVTVSWNAATSNVPQYAIQRYNVSAYYNGAIWETKGTTGLSIEFEIPTTWNGDPITSAQYVIRALDTNNQYSAYVNGPVVPVYFSPTLTVPSLAMQGQDITVNWTAIDGATSYTLQRKANTDADWTQVYSGANLSYTETVGTWTSVQYRVQAVFDGTPGGWAESAAIPVVSSSALVISGTDGDLGTVVNDIPYSISTDTGNQITATITVNSAVIFSGNVGNSTSDTIPVLDLVNGEGTIVIEASVQATSGAVSAVRTWTYTKAAITFPNAGSVAQLTKEGENIFPKTLAECVRLPGGKTLDEVTAFPAQVYTGSYVGTGTYGQSNPNTLTFPFEPKVWGILTFPSAGGAQATSTNLIPWGITPVVIQSTSSVCAYDGNTVNFYNATSAANQCNTSGATYYYIALG